jgi:hypothetical protein
MTSILNSVKKDLGLPSEYTAFDTDIIMAINTVFSVLTQIGAGPEGGFSISGTQDQWSDYISEDSPKLEFIKTYVSKRVRMIFDPPTSGSVSDAYKNVISELEWRINVETDKGGDEYDG